MSRWSATARLAVEKSGRNARQHPRVKMASWAADHDAAVENRRNEANMIYRRGGVYWYKFRWTIKGADTEKQNFTIRKSARTANLKRAREVEEEHRRALRIGLIHPADPW